MSQDTLIGSNGGHELTKSAHDQGSGNITSLEQDVQDLKIGKATQSTQRPQSLQVMPGTKSDEWESQVDPEHDPSSGKVEEEGQKKKKKKSRKKPSAKPSGFEEYFVDVPTPEEHREERSLYDPSKPVLERLQTAIHRYTNRRKFDPFRKLVFDKFMAYGRIKSGPNMFTGGIEETDPTLDAGDIARMRGQHFINDDVKETDIAIVDVAKGFLSSYLQQVVEVDEQSKISDAVGVLRNFYNYLLHHDVMPEFKPQIQEAKRMCDVAERELWLCAQAARIIPGPFNESCSLLCGGYHHEAYPRNWDTAKAMGVAPEIDKEKARKIFVAGLSAQASEESIDKYEVLQRQGPLDFQRQFENFFEVVEIMEPSQRVKLFYEHPINLGLSRVGKVTAKTWYNPGDAPLDLTPAEKARIERDGPPIEQYEFFVDDTLLQKMFPGMKIRATIRETRFGILYFDEVTSILPSFYHYMTNEDWLSYKPHRFLPQRDTLEPEDQGSVEAIIGQGGQAEAPKGVTELYGTKEGVGEASKW